ncbi:MAG: hypothetical protein N2Z70_02470 [Bdellovibrionaceae bacterium]|jgi:hypothetical protein|nr:hypothetical protein [Pseudobdellovibrionaceae bacterium]
MKASFRRSPRKAVYPLAISGLRLTRSGLLLSNEAYFVEVSEHGFKLLMQRKKVSYPSLRDKLDWSGLVGQGLRIWVEDFDLELEGTIKRVRHLGRGEFEIGVDYTANAPDYWRSCLTELLPRPDEVDEG